MERWSCTWPMIVLALVFGLLGSGSALAKDAIRIGAIVELTGQASVLGLENQKAIEAAAALINQRGGVEGYHLDVVVVDGASDPAVFVSKAQCLLNDEAVIAGIGGSDVAFATAAGEVFAKAKTPFADIGGTSPTISLISEYMFMAPGPDNDQGRAVARYLTENLEYDTFAIFKDVASAYGTKLTEYFIHFAKIFTNKADPVPLVLTYQTGDKDYSAQLCRLKAQAQKLGIQALVLPTWPQDAPIIARQARDLGIELPLVGMDGVDTSILTETGGNAVEGMIFSTHFHPDQPGLTETARDFVKEYREKYNDDPGAFGAMGYDALMIMAEAVGDVIKEKGPAWWDQADLAARRQATQESLLKITFRWTTQIFHFTKDGGPKKGQVWKVVTNGKREYIDFQPYQSFTPDGIDILPFK